MPVMNCCNTRSLNYDILVAILFCLDTTADVSRMMKTSKALHQAGWRHLLSFRIRIHVYNIDGFVRSVIPPDGTAGVGRCAYLRHLTIVGAEYTCSHLTHMATILEHAMNLRTLSVTNFEALNSFPDFAKAVANMKTLRWIDLDEAKKYAVTTLTRMNCPLVRLDFRSGPYGGELELARLIRNFADTLEYISIDDVYLRDLNIMCTRMRVLLLYEVPEEPFSSCQLVHAFPNLEILGLHGCYPLHDPHEHRARNQITPPDSPWRRLKFFEGSADYLWTLGLSFPIQVLGVRGDLLGNNYILEDLETAHTPEAMYFRIHPLDEDLLKQLERYFSSGPTWTNGRFEIEMSAFNTEDTERTPQIIERFVNMLKRLPLRYMEIRFSGFGLSVDDWVAEWWEMFDMTEVEVLAENLFSTIPTLERAYIEADWVEDSFWEFSDDTLWNLAVDERPGTFAVLWEC